MKAVMLLADAAQTVDNKLYILGGGWSIMGPNPTAMAIAIKIEVPWNQANRRHEFAVTLVDTDGKQVELPLGDEAKTNVVVEGEFEVGRPPGLAPGTALDVPLAINMGPLPLEPGSRYVWRLTIDGEAREDWQVAFDVRPAAS